MSKSILALDLGTNTGYAAGRLHETSVNAITGTAEFKTDRFTGGGMQFLRFIRWLDELHGVLEFTEVVFEEVRAHKGTIAAQVYGGFLAKLTSWCEEKDIPYEGVPVATIKKYATGKGNAGKQEVIDAVVSWGYTPTDDNEADAIALLHHAIAER